MIKHSMSQVLCAGNIKNCLEIICEEKKNISQNIAKYASFFLELQCFVDDLVDFLNYQCLSMLLYFKYII